MNDGGPAFPTSGMTLEAYHAGVAGQGMTLRDWFAGQALAVIAAESRACPVDIISRGQKAILEWRDECNREDVALCYKIADAMLAERDKGRRD